MSYVRGRVMVAFPISELYFLIAKFLSGGPLKETAQVNWLGIHLNNIYLEFRRVTEMFSVTDSAERARDRRGMLKLFLAGFGYIVVLMLDARGCGCQTAETWLKSFSKVLFCGRCYPDASTGRANSTRSHTMNW